MGERMLSYSNNIASWSRHNFSECSPRRTVRELDMRDSDVLSSYGLVLGRVNSIDLDAMEVSHAFLYRATRRCLFRDSETVVLSRTVSDVSEYYTSDMVILANMMRRFAAEPQLSTAMNAVNDVEANPQIGEALPARRLFES
jgi:hypothetical protein